MYIYIYTYIYVYILIYKYIHIYIYAYTYMDVYVLTHKFISGTIAFGRGNGYYDIQALYKCSSSGTTSCGYALLWESTGVCAYVCRYISYIFTQAYTEFSVELHARSTMD